MTKSLKSRVTEQRRLLGNPYAHIEYLETFASEATTPLTLPALDLQIQESRKLLQDPYAYLNESGGYSATLNRPTHEPKHVRSAQIEAPMALSNTAKKNTTVRHYTDQQIEQTTKDLHTRLWKEKESLWNGIPPTDPIELLDPAVALRLLGYEYSLDDGLGKHRVSGGQIEVAGLIDRTSKLVRVSRQFPMNVRMFTAAHELGHAALHQAGNGIHRDRPLDGAAISRDRTEIEADKFATYFLMPAKLVKARFDSLFGTDFFELNNDTAFALCGASVADIQAKHPTRRDISRLLAKTERYNNRHFNSLAAQFRVSVETMAIRLEELELLA